jgi:spore germination protein YaaH
MAHMRRIVPLIVALAIVGGGSAVAIASHGSAATKVALPAARAGQLQVIAFTDARPSPAARGSISAHLGSLDAISPAWLSLGPNGTIAYRDSDRFAQDISSRGAALYPVLRDPERRITSIISHRDVRIHTAMRLAAMVHALGAQGLVVELGQIPAADRAALPAFLRELRVRLPARAQLLLVVPPIGDAATQRREAGYDLRDLSRPATLVLQAFGGRGHAAGPHPIASLGWYKKVVRYTLAHAPRSRVIVELPTWGAVWGPTGPTRATQAALFRLARPSTLLATNGARVVRNGDVGYVESDRSLQLKLEVARAAHVAGIALWVRGGESTGVWREPLIAPPAT